VITQGPFSLVLNDTIPLEDPGATSNNPATQVQLQNATPFIIEVNVGGAVYTIQSFTAQTVPTSGGGQQMSVDPVESTAGGGGGGSLTIVWLLAGEVSPMQDGPLTAAAITAANLPPGQVYNNTVTPSSGIFSALAIPIPSNARTLVIYLTSEGGAWFTLLRVTGGPIGLDYYNQAPYLNNQPSNPGVAAAVVPIEGAGGTGFETISIVGEVSSGNAPVQLVVYADSLAYPESMFYNGPIIATDESLAAAGTVQVLEGPARLISAQLTTSSTVGASLTISGEGNILAAGATVDAQSIAQIAFPPDTILAAGAVLNLIQQSTGASEAAVTYAYP
jgi:hypothetical protein